MSMPLYNLAGFAAAEGAPLGAAGVPATGDGSGEFNKLFLNHIDTALSSESGDLSLDLEAALRAVLSGSSGELPVDGRREVRLDSGGNSLPLELDDAPLAEFEADDGQSPLAILARLRIQTEGDEIPEAVELAPIQGLVAENRGVTGLARDESVDKLLVDQGMRAATRLRLDAAGTQADFAQSGSDADANAEPGDEQASKLMAARANEHVQGARSESGSFNANLQTASPMALTTANPASQTTAGIPQLNIETPVQNPNWGRAMGDRIVWLVGQNQRGAEIRLNPPELGPLEVRVAVNQDQQTSLVFNTQNSSVRDAIEAALPRLREMLEEQGLDLADVDVRQDSEDGQLAAGQHGNDGTGDGQAYAEGEGGQAESETLSVLTSDGLLDTYA